MVKNDDDTTRAIGDDDNIDADKKDSRSRSNRRSRSKTKDDDNDRHQRTRKRRDWKSRHNASDSSDTDSQDRRKKKHKKRNSKMKKHRHSRSDDLRLQDKNVSNSQRETSHNTTTRRKDHESGTVEIYKIDQTIIGTTTTTTTTPTINPNEEIRPPEHTAATSSSNRSRMMIPMTRDEYERQQSQVRHVYDPESGRVRLIRGSGEILESIVSRSQHSTINQLATQSDGRNFTKHVFTNAAASSRRR